MNDFIRTISLSHFNEVLNKRAEIMFTFAPSGRALPTCLLAGAVSFVNNFYQSYSSYYTITAAHSLQHFLNSSFSARGRRGGQGLDRAELLWLWSVILNSMIIGNLLGTFCIPFCCERAGRKMTLLLSNCGIFFATFLTLGSVIFLLPELFLISRILGAALSSLNFGALVLFMTEFPATNFRGLAFFMGGLTFNIGTNVGMVFGTDALLGQNLVALVGVGLLPTGLAILLAIPLKETPKYLLLKREDKKAAMESLCFYQGNSASPDQLLKERQPEDKRPLASLLRELFAQRHLRLAALLSICALQLTIGIWPVNTTLLSSHFPVRQAQLFSSLSCAIGLLANIPGTLLADKVSRRKLLLITGSANAGSILLYVLFDRLSILDGIFRYGCVLANFLYFITFGIALGTIPFYIAGELFPQNFRSLGQSLVFCLALCSSFLFNLLTLPAFTLFGVWAFFGLFTAPQLLCLTILWKYLPETGHREVHQIVEDLKRGGWSGRSKVTDQSASTTKIVAIQNGGRREEEEDGEKQQRGGRR